MKNLNQFLAITFILIIIASLFAYLSGFYNGKIQQRKADLSDTSKCNISICNNTLTKKDVLEYWGKNYNKKFNN